MPSLVSSRYVVNFLPYLYCTRQSLWPFLAKIPLNLFAQRNTQIIYRKFLSFFQFQFQSIVCSVAIKRFLHFLCSSLFTFGLTQFSHLITVTNSAERRYIYISTFIMYVCMCACVYGTGVCGQIHGQQYACQIDLWRRCSRPKCYLSAFVYNQKHTYLCIMYMYSTYAIYANTSDMCYVIVMYKRTDTLFTKI